MKVVVAKTQVWLHFRPVGWKLGVFCAEEVIPCDDGKTSVGLIYQEFRKPLGSVTAEMLQQSDEEAERKFGKSSGVSKRINTRNIVVVRDIPSRLTDDKGFELMVQWAIENVH